MHLINVGLKSFPLEVVLVLVAGVQAIRNPHRLPLVCPARRLLWISLRIWLRFLLFNFVDFALSDSTLVIKNFDLLYDTLFFRRLESAAWRSVYLSICWGDGWYGRVHLLVR